MKKNKMEMEFEFDMNDWMEFQKNYLYNSKQFKQQKFRTRLILPVCFCILIIIDLLKSEVNPQSLIIYGIISILWIVFYPKLLFKQIFNRTKKRIEEEDHTGKVGKHKLVIDEESILYVEPEPERKIKWNEIKKIEESGSHYFLYDTDISAIIIPKNKVKGNIEQLDEIIKMNAV